ncbi:MAG: hypothetical protein A2047_05195 [Omnitrophica bacterium GWA2_41_15]|nr:MAG: hypothetical protein A2047_05195 [Omnitrophica bacterium GWA2_41_15]HAZ09535.1 hypothetical protein [Candidatus Omnitrophota bacterium]
MSKFLKLMSVLAIVALIAVPAFAEVQNVKVSGDIDSKMINRSNYDFNNGNTSDTDTWFMSTARLQVDADLTDNVSTSVRLLNERDWGVETAATTDIDLDLASVKMKEMFYAPLTLIIGRQNIRLGSGLVVGDPDTNDTAAFASITALDLSARKSFDAVRATLDYNPLVLDILMAKISTGAVLGGGNTNDDINLYGLNAAYKFNQYNSEAEAYAIARIDRNGAAAGATLKTDTTYVYGVRGSLEPISKLVVDAELAIQRGDFAVSSTKTMDRSAWAGDIGGSYAIDYKWSPKVALRYSYRSGQKQSGNDADDDTTGTNDYKAWDTMFEDQTHGIVANQIFNGNNDGVDSNGSTINVMASVVPVQDLTVAVDYYNFMLAEKWIDLDVTTRTTFNVSNVRSKKNLGQELDLSLGYDYTEDVKLGLTAGFFMPGKTFLKHNNDMASTVMADVKVSF